MDNKAQIKASLNALMALADAIKELGSVPAGELYSVVMGHLDQPTFDSMIGILCRSGVVSRSPGHLLTWKGAA